MVSCTTGGWIAVPLGEYSKDATEKHNANNPRPERVHSETNVLQGLGPGSPKPEISVYQRYVWVNKSMPRSSDLLREKLLARVFCHVLPLFSLSRSTLTTRPAPGFRAKPEQEDLIQTHQTQMQTRTRTETAKSCLHTLPRKCWKTFILRSEATLF